MSAAVRCQPHYLKVAFLPLFHTTGFSMAQFVDLILEAAFETWNAVLRSLPYRIEAAAQSLNGKTENA